MIVVIGKTGCNKCERLQNLLTKHNIPFTKVNLDNVAKDMLDFVSDVLSELSLQQGHAENLPILVVDLNGQRIITCGYGNSKQFLRDNGFLGDKS